MALHARVGKHLNTIVHSSLVPPGLSHVHGDVQGYSMQLLQCTQEHLLTTR